MPYANLAERQEYHKQYYRQWAVLNREKLKVNRRKWLLKKKAEDPDWEAAKQRKYVLRHPGRTAEFARKYRAEGRHLDSLLRRTYGLTAAQYKFLLARQNDVCAICLRVEPGKRLSVDHEHQTGRVRALLCTHCNRAILGKLTIETARRALAILESDFDARTVVPMPGIPGLGLVATRRPRG